MNENEDFFEIEITSVITEYLSILSSQLEFLTDDVIINGTNKEKRLLRNIFANGIEKIDSGLIK